jgi:hypothetical protein
VPEAVPLPDPWRERGWRLKIYDRETREPPHATLIHRTGTWRWDLRRQQIMDRVPPSRRVPAALVEAVRELQDQLVDAWDRRYPDNPVRGRDE